jgi:hypothetical protein
MVAFIDHGMNHPGQQVWIQAIQQVGRLYKLLKLPSDVSDGPKTDETCRFENRVLACGSKPPSEGCPDGGVGLDWMVGQGGLIWSLVR